MTDLRKKKLGCIMTINGRCLVQFLTLSISLVNLQLADFFSPKHPFGFKENHCQKLGTRWRLRVRTKTIMAANSYKKMHGDKETCSNISIMSLRVFGARLETC